MSNLEIIKKGNKLSELLEKVEKANVIIDLVWSGLSFSRGCQCPSNSCSDWQNPETPTIKIHDDKTTISSEVTYYGIDDGGWGPGNVAYPEQYFHFGLILKQNSVELWTNEWTARGSWEQNQSFKFLLAGLQPIEDTKTKEREEGLSPRNYLFTTEEAIKITSKLLGSFYEQVKEALNEVKAALA